MTTGEGSTVVARPYWLLRFELLLDVCGGGKRPGTMLVLLIAPVVEGCCLTSDVGATTEGDGGMRFALASTKPIKNQGCLQEMYVNNSYLNFLFLNHRAPKIFSIDLPKCFSNSATNSLSIGLLGSLDDTFLETFDIF